MLQCPWQTGKILYAFITNSYQIHNWVCGGAFWVLLKTFKPSRAYEFYFPFVNCLYGSQAVEVEHWLISDAWGFVAVLTGLTTSTSGKWSTLSLALAVIISEGLHNLRQEGSFVIFT